MSKTCTICGNPDSFAIECEVINVKDKDWVFGHFRFWLQGIAVGDWDDSVSLAACANWLQEFVDVPMDRYEPGLLSLPKSEVFDLLLDSVTWDGQEYKPYINIYGRFHIDHLGMSAFNRYDILLVEDQERQRVLWRQGEDPTIHEAYFPAGEIQKVAKVFVEWFRNQIHD